ncbi:MAG: hypothetical protein HY710_01600 [Candidatus Latescibacteria bacterium]|nr:hypothetical protein [Candidatus Latescibacterota bacterium]
MDIQTALWNLGVREHTLTPDEQRSLDEHGFVILRQMIARRLTPEMRYLLDA